MRSEGEMGPSYSVEELLSFAQVGERVTEEEIAESRRAIEQEFAATVWRGAMSYDSWAQTANSTWPERIPQRRRSKSATCGLGVLRQQAAEDLGALSTLVLRDSEASEQLLRLATKRRIDPEGTLIFACLLHLGGRDEAAQFWWQFSAGAGSTTSALCLYLLHMQRGELRDAEHWAGEAAELEELKSAVEPSGVRLESCSGRWSRPSWMVTRTLHELRPDHGRVDVTGLGRFRSRLPRSLSAAVHRLQPVTDTDDELGEVLRPDPGLSALLDDGLVGA